MSAESVPVQSEAEKSPRLLVVGCGNPLAGDDSAGVEVVRRLREAGTRGCEFCLLTADVLPMLERLSSVDVILLVDAVIRQSTDATPGSLHLVPLSFDRGSGPLSPDCGIEPRSMSSLSSHGWGLLETLKLARALGRPIPRVILLGVEIAQLNPGARRSPTVERAITVVVERFSHLQFRLADAASFLWHAAQHFPPDETSFPGNM